MGLITDFLNIWKLNFRKITLHTLEESRIRGVDPEKRDSFDVNTKKELICWDGLRMVHGEPKFYK